MSFRICYFLRNVFPLVLLLWAACFSTVVLADHWSGWRGPNDRGVAEGSGYPVEWSETENVRWKVAVPGWGTSSPAVWQDKIFLTAAAEGQNRLLCLDRDGKQKWSVTLGDADENRNRKASAANPSVVTDGKHAYAYFKSGDLACVDLDGKTIWHINVQDKYGRDSLGWDLGTSPVLTHDAVVIAVMHQGPSYLLALDKASGAEKWKVERELGAPAEARDSYSTPVVYERDGEQVVLVLGADHVTAYEAATGKEIWRVGDLNPEQRRNYRSIASPALDSDLIIAPYARGNSLTAIRRGGEGDVTSTHVAWTVYGTSADVPTPIALDGRVYVCGDRGEIWCLDSKTGKEIWNQKLPRNRYPFSASPVIAEGRLYATREDGTTFVLQLSDGELLSTNTLRENTYATPAFVDGQIFVRTSDYLICVGEKEEG